MKYLILAVLLYFVYRTFIRPALAPGDQQDRVSQQNTGEEYIDYEEVKD